MRRVGMCVGVLVLAGAAVWAAEPGGAAAKKYGYLGVTLSAVPEALGAQLGLEKGEGILVTGIEDGSPADKAGIKRNDVVTMIDDQIILSEEQMRKLVAFTEPGRELKVKLIRKGEAQTVTVKVGETDKPPAAGAPQAWQGVAPPDMIVPLPGVGVPGGLRGGVRVYMTTPDGKTRVLDGAGQADDMLKELEKFEQKGVIDKKTLEALKKAMTAAEDAEKPGVQGPKKLDEVLKKPVTADFRETSLIDVLQFLRGLGAVNIILDPALAAKDVKVTLTVREMALSNVLEWLGKLADAQCVAANGAVCVGKGPFAEKFKALTPIETDDEKMAAALKRPVSFDFADCPFQDVVEFMNGLLKVNIVILGGTDAKETVTLKMQDVPAGLVLRHVGLLLDREVTAEKQAVRFAPRAGAAPK